MKNYLEFKKLLPSIFRHFAFFDDYNNSATSLFFRNKVQIKVRSVARQNGEKYQIVVCDVRKRDVQKFLQTMEELKNKMLLIGNTDYEAFCEKWMSKTMN